MKTGRKKASIALIMVLCAALLLGACGAAGEGAAGSAPENSAAGDTSESGKTGTDDKAAEAGTDSTGTDSTGKDSGKEDGTADAPAGGKVIDPPEGIRFIVSDEFAEWFRTFDPDAHLSWGEAEARILGEDRTMEGTLMPDMQSFSVLQMNVTMAERKPEEVAELAQEMLDAAVSPQGIVFDGAAEVIEAYASSEEANSEQTAFRSGIWLLVIGRHSSGLSLKLCAADGEAVSTGFTVADAETLFGEESDGAAVTRDVTVVHPGEEEPVYGAKVVLDYQGRIERIEAHYSGEDMAEGKAFSESLAALLLEGQALEAAKKLLEGYETMQEKNTASEKEGRMTAQLRRMGSDCIFTVRIRVSDSEILRDTPPFVTEQDEELLAKDAFEREGIYTGAQIGETVIYDIYGMKITAEELVYGRPDLPSLGVRLKVEASSEAEKVPFYVMVSSVNGVPVKGSGAVSETEMRDADEHFVWICRLDDLVEKVPGFDGVSELSLSVRAGDARSDAVSMITGYGDYKAPEPERETVFCDTDILYGTFIGDAKETIYDYSADYDLRVRLENRGSDRIRIDGYTMSWDGFPMAELYFSGPEYIDPGQSARLNTTWSTSIYKDEFKTIREVSVIVIRVKYTNEATGEEFLSDPIYLSPGDILDISAEPGAA